MPLGVSEQLLEKALGPVDLSFFYKKIDSLNQKMAMEDAARRKEAMKSYETELATINKDIRGIRDKDIAKATELYNQWSDAEKTLASNPNLINKNPRKYGELKSYSNDIYGQLQEHITGSKALKEREKADYEKIKDPSKIEYWLDDAAKNYYNNVISNTLEDVRKNQYDDLTRYYETKIDGSKFHSGLVSVIDKTNKDLQVEDPTYKSIAGVKRIITYKNVPTDYSLVKESVYNHLGILGDKKVPKYAAQDLKEAVDNGDYYETYKQVQDFNRDDNPNGHKKYGVPKIPLTEFDDSLPNTAKYVNYISAKNFIERYKSPEVKSEIKKMDPIAWEEYISKRREQAAMRIAIFRQKNGQDDYSQPADYTPSFQEISKGGETGIAAMKRFYNSFNATEKIGASVFPIVANEEAANKDNMFAAGNKLVQNIVNGKFELGLLSPEKRKEKIDKFADDINQYNREHGFPDSDITGGSLRSGKAVVLYTDPANYVILDLQNEASRNYINRKIRSSQLSTKKGQAIIEQKVRKTGEPFKYIGMDENDNAIF